MKKICRIWFLIGMMMFSIILSAQQLTGLEYYFDKDPGIGKANKVALSATYVDTSFSFSVTTLSTGLHTLFIRAFDQNGYYSITKSGNFIKYDGVDSIFKVVYAEYFFDTDPGLGKATAIDVVQSNPIEKDFTINIPDNGKESRNFYLRVKDSYGKWSILQQKTVSLCNIYKSKADFIVFRYGNRYSFLDSSTNNPLRSYQWLFDDGSKDSVQNPVRELSFGKHNVRLIAGVGCRADTITKPLYTGVENFSPKEVMAGGDMDLTIYGGGLDTTAVVTLRDQQGKTYGPVFRSYSKDNARFRGQFDLHDITFTDTTRWDILVRFPKSNADTVIKSALTVLPKPKDTTIINPKLRISLNIPRVVNASTWYTGSVVITNTGKVTAKVVPFELGVDHRMLDFEFAKPVKVRATIPDSIKLISPYTITDKTFGDNFTSRIYQLYLQEVGPGQSITISFRFLTPTNLNILNNDMRFYAKVYPRMSGSNPQKDAFDCFMGSASFALAIAGLVATPALAGPIALSSMALALNQTIGDLMYDQESNDPGMASNFNSNMMGVGVNATQLPGTLLELHKDVKIASDIMFGRLANVFTAIQAYQTVQSCYTWWNNGDQDKVQRRIFFSSDPNELTANYDADTVQHYIRKERPITYTIHFENESKASRNVQRVLLRDTLDRTRFDFGTFKLMGFTIGDSVYQVPDLRKEYTVTVDRKKEDGVNIRYNARFDTATGIFTARLDAIDPATGNLVSDTTLNGFLPPHSTGTTGQGTVSFQVNQVPMLNNLATISNRAAIYFDNNASIRTNTFTHTLDTLPPTGKVSGYRLANDTTFVLYFTASDKESGVGGHQFFQSINKGLYLYAGVSVTDSIVIKGQKDSVYQFYSQPLDQVGNLSKKQSGSEVVVQLFNVKPIQGDSVVCSGKSLKLTSAVTGGTWQSSDNSIATIDAQGNLTGVSAGIVTVSYKVTQQGIDGIVTKAIRVLASPAVPTITKDNNNNLVSSATFGNTWYKDGSQIADTTRTIKPVLPGYYSVKTTQGGCTSNQSASYYYLVTAIDPANYSNGQGIRIVPTMVNERMYIDAGSNGHQIRYQLIDMSGRIFLTSTFTRSVFVNMKGVAAGVYYVLFTDTQTRQQSYIRVVKQ